MSARADVALAPGLAPLLAVAGSERARRWIVALTLLVLVLLVGEGALRKWVLPTQGRLLFFVRDPFVVAIYIIAAVGGWWPRGRVLLNAGLALAALGVLAAGVQLMAGAADPKMQSLLAVYGIRNYFLYLPLPFVVGATFRRDDVMLVAKAMLALAVPIAVLVFAQFFSPGSAPINAGISDDLNFQFRPLGLIGGRIRPSGPFTSDIGQKEFTIAVLSLGIALWLMPTARRKASTLLLAAGTGAALTCLAMSGSRGAMLHAGILMIAAMGVAVVAKAGATTVRALLIPPVVVLAAVLLYPVLFPEGHEAFTARWDAAAANEGGGFLGLGLVGRGLYNVVDFAFLVGHTPILGYGIGLAGNAAILLGVEIEGFSGWTETDWSRHIVDLGPLLGIGYIVLRLALTAWLATLAFRALRARGDPLPLMLVAFAGLDLLQGQLTGHGSVNGFTWLFSGFALAAASSKEPASRARVVATAGGAPLRRFPNLVR